MEMEGRKHTNRLLGLLFTGVLMGALDIAIVGPALPAIRESFGVDDRAAAWILSIYILFNLVGTPLMAKLSDSLGRRVIYVMDVAIFASGSLLVALAPSFGLLLVGRSIQGVGAGGIFPVASAVIGDVFPVERRGSALGLIGAVFGIAFIIGPILGGVLLIFGWPWLFLVNLPIAVGVIIGGWRLLPATRPTRRHAFDISGMLLLGGLLAALAYGLNRLDAAHLVVSLRSGAVGPFLLLAMALLPVFAWTERRAADPVLRPGLLRSRQVTLVSAISLGSGFAEAGIVFVPALLVAAYGVSTSTASFMLLPIVLAMSVGAPASGRVVDRRGSKVVVIAAAASLGGGLLLVSLFPGSLALIYTGGAFIGLGLSAVRGSALRYVMLYEAPAADRAAGQAVLTVFTSTGRLLGAAFVGALIASHGGQVRGFSLAFLVLAVIMGALTLAALALKSRTEELHAIRQHETFATVPGAVVATAPSPSTD